LCLVVGVVIAAAAQFHALGTAARMGPGYFPLCLGVILALLGIAQMFRACHGREDHIPLEAWDWPTLLLLTGAVVLFAAAIYWLGLVLALAFLVILSSAASHEFTWKGTLANLFVILALNLSVFVYGLSLPFQLWPTAG
jgi:uncharacterized membrane protein HdeD (DUF308 family)